MRSITLAIAFVALAGCTALKATYKSNEGLLVDIAPALSGPLCQKAAASLQPQECQAIAAGLGTCTIAFQQCSTPAPPKLP